MQIVWQIVARRRDLPDLGIDVCEFVVIPDCIQQGIDILAARDELPGITMRIYSFDGELESPIADAFMQQYNISEYPSTVIDGRVYSGPITKDEIVGEIAE